MSLLIEREPTLGGPTFPTRRDTAPEAPPSVAVGKRLVSLDVFRGITIAAMLLVNNPGTIPASVRALFPGAAPYAALEHAEWHGWTPTDLVFPFFLFIVGVATPFSLAKRGVSQHFTTGQHLGRIWTRALALILLGVLLAANNLAWPFVNTPDGYPWSTGLRIFGFCFVYGSILLLLTPWPWRSVSTILPIVIGVMLLGYLITMHFVRAHALAAGWPPETFGSGAFNPDMLRIPGVLQRIGICYGIAASIALFTDWRGVLLSTLVLCAVYSVLMLHAKFPGKDLDTVGSLTKENNFARYVDESVLERRSFDVDGTPIIKPDGSPVFTQKHTYSEYPDNEGIISTLPAVATALIGVLVGLWLRTPNPPGEHAAGVLSMGLVVSLAGLYLDHALMPINKNLWTPSFAVFTAGMAMLVLGFVYWLVEVCGRRAWAWPFKVMGMNAIAAFVLANIMVRVSRLVLVTEPSTGKNISTLGYVNNRVIDWMQTASAKWHGLNAYLPAFDSPQNLSLAYALCFVFMVFLVMWVLYVCRVFVKV